jgi:hypothetical protein
MTSQRLTYFPAMFAACMLFQVIYVLCVVLWLVAPELKGHAILIALFPQFEFLDTLDFIYGLVASAVYGWFVAIVFVFFFNLWPSVASTFFGRRAVA